VFQEIEYPSLLAETNVAFFQVYTTARLGLFDTFTTEVASYKRAQGKEITIVERSVAGLAAGGIAAMIGNPADLALIRMQSDGLKPVDQRANYKSVFDALVRIAKNEGVATLWDGCRLVVVLFSIVLRDTSLTR
jgi:solute carrier family 25 oxoglutarate transporter 11